MRRVPPGPSKAKGVDGHSSFPLLSEALGYLRDRMEAPPRILLVLGSGLGGLADAVERPTVLPFSEVPGLPGTGVEGHAGRWVMGDMEGSRILIQAGRFHHYEGHPAQLIGAPIRLAAQLGVEVVILTNAAGGIAPSLTPGSLMLLDDHLNLQWRSPLAGWLGTGVKHPPDLRSPFDDRLQAKAMELALRLGIPLTRGTYAAVLGPSYETPAEVRLLRTLGAHAVGMSTVPEVISARALGLRVVAFSLITNRAAGLEGGFLAHADVLKVGAEAGRRLEALLRSLVGAIASSEV
jgi:purine-nucleoside phosphorylase